jgi:hypothetical protein
VQSRIAVVVAEIEASHSACGCTRGLEDTVELELVVLKGERIT